MDKSLEAISRMRLKCELLQENKQLNMFCPFNLIGSST